MNHLTQQIAGAYIGAQVEVSNNGKIASIAAAFQNRLCFTYDGDSHLFAPYDQCRLILTPLSAISDEDAVEVGKLANVARYQVREFIGCNKDDFFMIGRYLASEFNVKTYIELRIHTDRYIAIIDYLRSRNYDLGYMGIRSLIDAGIAISSTDKTETK